MSSAAVTPARVAVTAPQPAPSPSSEVLVPDAVRDAIAAPVESLRSAEPGVRSGDDPEDVHRARVAIRRLRSFLQTFGDVLEPAFTTELRDELRWLGRLLGEIRDFDVLRDRLRSRAGWIAAEDAPVVDRLVAELQTGHDGARARLAEEMASARYPALIDALDAAAREPAVLPGAVSLPADVALRPGLEKLWKHLDGAVAHVMTEGTDRALHVVRIGSKRVRYAAEAVTPVFGKPTRRFAKAAAALQEVLGEHQDAVVAAGWLRREAVTTPEVAFVAGELATLEVNAARSARAAWPDAWRALSRKKLRFWS